MSGPIFGVVALNRGHRTIVRVSAQTGESREQLESWAMRRDRHPNAIALSITHEVIEVEAAPTDPTVVGRCRNFREARQMAKTYHCVSCEIAEVDHEGNQCNDCYARHTELDDEHATEGL